jgi:hypothetical protein
MTTDRSSHGRMSQWLKSCPLDRGADAGSDDAQSREVYIELVELETLRAPDDRSSDAKRPSLPVDPMVRPLRSIGVLATSGVPRTVAPEGDSGGQRAGLVEITATLTPAPSRVLLELAFDGARMHFEVLSEHPVVVGLPEDAAAGARSRVFVVTPYVLHSKEDMRRIHECKEQQRARFSQL